MGTEKGSLHLTNDPVRQALSLLEWICSWDAVGGGKKSRYVFFTRVGFLLILIFVLGLLSNAEWTGGRRSCVVQGDLIGQSLCAESKS